MAKKPAPSIKARVTFRPGDEPVVLDVMNPGEGFGKVHILGIAISNAINPNFVIEADSLQDAIDVWADSDRYGNLINMDDDTVKEAVADGLEITYAGNDGHAVDIDNVGESKFHKIEYFVEIPDLTDCYFVASLQEVIDKWHEEHDEPSE